MAKQKSGFLSALGVLFALFKQVMDGVLAAGGGDDDLRDALNNADTLGKIVEIIMSSRKSVRAQVLAWEKFYEKYFELRCDFSGIKIPERKPGFDRLIIVAGLTLNQVYDVCAKHFPCWRYADDLDSAVSINDRDPKNGGYAIWVRDRVEADEELKNLSADQLKAQGIVGETLLERMLHELKYWDETEDHLDKENWTLCSGSRDSVGDVPGACWGVGRFRVVWDDSDGHYGHLRARAAVPLPAKQAA